MSTAIVYVQLGMNPSKTLIPFAKLSVSSMNNATHILLTDQPQFWNDFPGEIVDISRFVASPGYVEFELKNKELRKIAGGYWLNTLKRLFVLEALKSSPSKWEDIVHYESDVYPLLTQELIECMRHNIRTAGVPRFSKDRGVASILYIRNRIALESLIENFSTILSDARLIRDDMELLGTALNKRLIQELPSVPRDAWSWGRKNYIFDGAAYGQYLFGQDPFHTNGQLISGYKNPDFGIDVSGGKWSINKNDDEVRPKLLFNFHDKHFELANVHIHSKLVLNEISLNDQNWRRYLREANGYVERKTEIITEKSVHENKLSTITRFRIARKNGIIKVLKRKFRNLLNT